ncbi:MAG: hypothetical protein KatS3mg013_0342 [Actinomycetota bacterium]|nr:MAG: hypothetical protein KatS3mg013_0342 [Actinomycetota bacterium]
MNSSQALRKKTSDLRATVVVRVVSVRSIVTWSATPPCVVSVNTSGLASDETTVV